MVKKSSYLAHSSFEPPLEKIEINKGLASPFFTNLDKSVYAVTMLPPEMIGALASRTSRAKDDLRIIFVKEFVEPFVSGNDPYGRTLKSFIRFFHRYPYKRLFSNPKAREFYIKWLAQYGDDSIAQMAGAHLIYTSLSQIAIKHLEDMRIGIAPIEKSTRYVDYSSKINGRYRYYTDPTLRKMGLEDEYRDAMNHLFDTYMQLISTYYDILKSQFPDEKEMVLKTKAFDTMRGLLPMSTLSQVAFFGNGQAFEYMVTRSLDHHLGEIRWAGREAFIELSKIIPAFLRRAKSEQAAEYRKYLQERMRKMDKVATTLRLKRAKDTSETVKLLSYDIDGEARVIASLLFPYSHLPYEDVLSFVSKMSDTRKDIILSRVLRKRRARWYKVPRAFESANVRFEITMNIGGWRDIHRHRILSQSRQRFSIHHGYDVPPELIEAKLELPFTSAIEKAEKVFRKIEKKDPELAQYAVTLSHKMRFIQEQNLRSLFWEAELRTIAQGHPDYRHIEQQKARIVQKIYPLIGKYMQVDFNEYHFARRGTAEKIKAKEEKLMRELVK